MSLRSEDGRTRGLSRAPTLQEKVAQLYYSHGLFCSSYSVPVIVFAISIGLFCCLPLLSIPLPGNIPKQTWASRGSVGQTPFLYVQQVVLRTAVLPWSGNLYLGDAFRAPLYEAFKLLDLVRNHQDADSGKGLGHVCLHVEAIKKEKDGDNLLFPQYSCLVLSPGNLWHQDVHFFAQDAAILTRIFNNENIQKSKTSVAEMLFGMHLSDTGFRRYPMRNRQRIVQYAITFFLKENDERFLASLRHKLYTVYPLHQNHTLTPTSPHNDTLHIHYPGDLNYAHFLPLTLAYILLFLYYYFSVRKMALINSKVSMALTASLTVLFSLGMTAGICFFFGLTLSHQGKEMFPYLVVIVGLENVLVLTKSVVSTPTHLDVKIRMARGLSKEGWFITKNLLIEITILTIGLFTFVPVIQEFCIFAIVALLCDFFLQMLLFSTCLGIDTRRMDNLVVTDDANHVGYRHLYEHNYYGEQRRTMGRSKSHPRLNALHGADVVAQTHTVHERRIPKRLRLVNFWARTRFFQRAFMLIMVIWIGRILYEAELINRQIVTLGRDGSSSSSERATSFIDLNYYDESRGRQLEASALYVNYVTPAHDFAATAAELQTNRTDGVDKLRHPNYAAWLRLSSYHWSSILRRYNVSVGGRTVAILPAIRISHAIAPEQAILLRNPHDRYGAHSQWQALAAALDPIDFNDLDTPKSSNTSPLDRPFYPTSPMELFLTAILCIISALVLAYAVIVLYRCVCTRNYAEWRASWFASADNKSGGEDSDVPVLLEAVPVILDGHAQDVECVATDGVNVASCCLGGQIKVWDAADGELLTTIDRRLFFATPTRPMEGAGAAADDVCSDYESGSPPSRDETTSPLSTYTGGRINLHFGGLRMRETARGGDCFDFGVEYRQQQQRRERAKEQRNAQTGRWIRAQTTKQEEGMGGADERKWAGKIDSPIWCMDYVDNLIVIGCANGRVELWEGTTGKLKCTYEDSSGIGVTSVRILGSRIVVARLYGSLDFLQLQSYNQGRPIDWHFTCAYRRTHARTSSAGSISDYRDIMKGDGCEDTECARILSTRAHQQPITCLDVEGGRVLTGSQDHTLKVFRLEDGTPLYTLHGHCGPITCLFIDRVCPATSGSGSQDGMLCVWDLLTGACMYSIQAHDGSITSLTYSASYVISLGADERLRVWERFQGHLLNTIPIAHNFPSNVVMLTPHLLVTSRSGNLIIWDVRTGECVRSICLGRSPYVFVKQMVILRGAVLCDFGRQLRIVRFPLITRKVD